MEETKELEGILMLKVNGKTLYLNPHQIKELLNSNKEGEEVGQVECCNL